LLAINDDRFTKRSEIIWEKGTNRAEFFRGEVNKYGWVDTGSSFLPSEIIAAYLWAQLENLDDIQKRRIEIWNQYFEGLNTWAGINGIKLPVIPEYATNNGHIFFMVCKSADQRNAIISHLKKNGIYAVFHYLSLHKSNFYRSMYNGDDLIQSDNYSECLLRLPLFYELKNEEIALIISTIIGFNEKIN
jgi:dTDP-4-amino-4,6-dideoxygalactose transaminase